MTALLFAAKHWKLLGIGALVLLLSVTSVRLHHAKSDQWDRTMCVKGFPCQPVMWKTEVLQLRPALKLALGKLNTCHVNLVAVGDRLEAQNLAVAELKAESDARVKASRKAVSDARAVAESYRQSAALILSRKPGADLCRSAEELIDEAVR